MSKVVFGEIDWNSGDVGSGGGSDFMRLEQSSKNRVRVVGNPVQFYTHWIETPDGKKKKINSPIGDAKLVKRLEDAGFKRQARWFIKVLDRADGQFKLLEIGSQIYKGIKDLVQSEEWGPVTSYDITIARGAPGKQPLYSVMPCAKAPLDASVKEALTAFNDRVDLSKLTQPADPDEVRKLLGWKDTGSKATVTEDEDDLFNFES